MQIDTKIDPRWCEALLGMLEGDLSHSRVAEAKQMLRSGIDSIRKVRPDTSATTELSHLLDVLPNKIPDGSGGYIEKPDSLLSSGTDMLGRNMPVQFPSEVRGCLFSGPGRGDCEHFVGLPGKSIPGRHDGPDDTVDEYGRPNGWCEVCWRGRQIQFLKRALFQSSRAYGGVGHATCSVDLAMSRAKINTPNEYTAYVIKTHGLRIGGRSPVYRTAVDPGVSYLSWSPDIDKAFQFARRIDAERYMGNSDGTDEVVEHGFEG